MNSVYGWRLREDNATECSGGRPTLYTPGLSVREKTVPACEAAIIGGSASPHMGRLGAADIDSTVVEISDDTSTPDP